MKLTLPQWLLITLLGFLLTDLTRGDSTDSEDDLPRTISVVLLGRKGSGITSTVRQILGSRTHIHAAEVVVASTDILEYTLRVPVTTASGKQDYNYLKLVDVPGLELGDNLEHDGEILSTLKSYLHTKGIPTFFLVVFRFDDNQISEAGSKFRQLLKGVEFVQRALFQTTTDNTLFLLTRLLNEPMEVQQSPNAKIEEFRKVIQEATTLPSPVEILVGDNKPDNNTAQIQNGFFKLPNNELYPKNVLDKLAEVVGRSTQEDGMKDAVVKVVKTLTETRETAEYHTQEIVAHPTDEDIFENDLEAFEYLLRQDNLELPTNEIQSILQATYDEQDANTQISSCVQLLALRICLRNLNLAERIDQLPQTLSAQVKFFQKDVHGVMTSKYSLYYLKHALALEVPEFPLQNLVVGFGYDIINDRLLRKTPFLRNPAKRPSSSLGYQFPDFVECEKLVDVEETVLANSTDNLELYHNERLKFLTLSDKENVVLAKLKGEPKSYLNLKSTESGSLAAVKEIRVLECRITIENDTIAIVDENFLTAVNSLPPLNVSNSASLKEWKIFFHGYGTHIVTKSFGGGCYQGLILLTDKDSLAIKENVQESLNGIISFQNLEAQTSGRSQLYEFHVGEGDDVDPKTAQIHRLSQSERNGVLESWKNQLNAQFEMLQNELELVPISQLISVINVQKGANAESATRLLYQGKLETENTEAGTPASPSLLRENAQNQALKLKTANYHKIMEQINQLHDFLREISTTNN